VTNLRAKLAYEIREAIPPTIFFLLLFHLIALTKAVLLEEYSVTALRATVATVGALIVAKAILLVEALPLSRWFSARLLSNVLWKTLLFGAVAMLFRLVEEIIPLLLKHESLTAALVSVDEEINWPQFWAFQLWLFGALFLYCLAAELVREIGGARVMAMIIRPQADTSGQRH
jgi:hypothetical protein